MTSSASIVDPEPESRASVATSLRSLIPKVRAYESVAELEPAATDPSLLIVNYDALGEGERRALKVRLGAMRGSRCVLCSTGTNGAELADLCDSGGLTNIVARNHGPDRDEVVVTVRKLIEGKIFGIEQYFEPDARASDLELQDSDRRDEAVEAAAVFAREAGVGSRLVNLFATLTDELVTNGLFNAPTDAQGVRRFSTFPRTERIRLGSHEAIQMRLLAQPGRLGISVTDPFGSLSADQVRAYMATYFRCDRRSPRRTLGGAGLGLFQAFEAVTQFVCNIRRASRTEVIGTMDVGGGYRDFAARAKSFNVFVEGPAA